MAVVKIEGKQSCRAAVLDAGAHWLAQQHQLIARIGELDASEEWAADGATSCAHWIASALEVDLSTAREWVRVGRALRLLDEVDAAFADGRVSYSKVRTLSRIATPETQSELLELADHVPAGRLGHALAAWQMRRETPAETESRQRSKMALWWHSDADGMAVMTVRLLPADMARVQAAVDGRVRNRRPDASADASTRWPSLANQRADAFVELCRDGVGGVTTEVVLHIRGDGCTMDDGTPVAESVVARIAPTAFVRALIHDAEGHPVNASGRHRHPTTRQRRVVHERDRRCVDCGATDLLEYDHDPPFEETHRTVVDELRMRCASCHHRRHRIDP
jgi:hypothetical protein